MDNVNVNVFASLINTNICKFSISNLHTATGG